MAPERVTLWRWIGRRFRANKEILIVLDRRKGDRRRRTRAVAQDRRRDEDRRRPENADLGEVNGFLGAGSRFQGDLTFRGAFRVDGDVEGATLRGEVLIVGEQGRVDSAISVDILHAGGKVRGDITANRWAELLDSSRVTGTIRTPRLTIWRGAVFNGTCEMPDPAEHGSPVALAADAPRAWPE